MNPALRGITKMLSAISGVIDELRYETKDKIVREKLLNVNHVILDARRTITDMLEDIR